MPIQIVRNDITRMPVDAIVNAANRTLLGGGGVDGAIHRAAGPQLLDECRTLGGCRTGEAKLTGAYRLPCKYVIHTVGPIWRGGQSGEAEALASCYRQSLLLAQQKECESIAFPLISTGAYGFPRAQAISIAMQTIGAFLLESDMMVYLVVFDRASFLTGSRLSASIRQYIDDHYVSAHTIARTENMRAMQAQAFDDDLGMEAPPPCAVSQPCAAPMSLEDALRELDEGFSQAVLRLIDQKGMTDPECYKRANLDRKHFSKIRSNPQYKPSKPTAVALAIALQLTLDETRELLQKAGLALSHSSKFDIIIEYCILNSMYDVHAINQLLFEFDQPLLGA